VGGGELERSARARAHSETVLRTTITDRRTPTSGTGRAQGCTVRLLLLLGFIPAASFADAGVEPPTGPVAPPAEPIVEAPVGLPVPPPAPAPEQPQSAADVANAPRPGTESGRLDPLDTGDGVMRVVGRGLLFIPRLPLELVFQPVRGVFYVQDRYNAAGVVAAWFTTEDKRIAIFPTALVETGFGLNVGVRASFKNMLGAGERLNLRAGFGGRFRTIAEAKLTLGEKEKTPVSVGVLGRLEARDQDRFFGYGNGDTVDAPGMLIDPTTDATAIDTRYSVKTSRIVPFVRARLPGNVALLASAAITRDRTDNNVNANQLQIDEVYDISRLPGFGKRDALYAELEASWDTRRPANRFDGQGMRGAGHLVSVFGGRYEGLADNTINFYRGGFDLQQFVALTQGPRALEFRVFAEAVTGPRDEIPFLELPRLGGQRLLRGYNIDRFRDKVAAVGQVGYLFSLSRYVAMTIFADVGRVYADVDALTWRDQRVGFGTALEIYSSTGMVARAEIAGSADGSVFAYLSLDPVFDTRARTDRR